MEEDEIPIVKHDPNGLVKRDIDHLRRVFKRRAYSPKFGISEIMFEEGMQKVIDYIDDKMIAKR